MTLMTDEEFQTRASFMCRDCSYVWPAWSPGPKHCPACHSLWWERQPDKNPSIECPCCGRTVDKLERHHWFEENGDTHTQDICISCNHILWSYDHILPPWPTQVNYVLWYRSRNDSQHYSKPNPYEWKSLEVLRERARTKVYLYLHPEIVYAAKIGKLSEIPKPPLTHKSLQQMLQQRNLSVAECVLNWDLVGIE